MSAWRRSTFSTRKTLERSSPQYRERSSPPYSLPEAVAAAVEAVVVAAEAVVAAAAEAVAAAAEAVALEAVEVAAAAAACHGELAAGASRRAGLTGSIH
jgi:hypothetical protein